MAEDRKPKIDLKSRLQKMGGPAAGTQAPSAGGGPVPPVGSPRGPSLAPVAPPSIAPPPAVPRSGAPGRPPPGLDPANPLAAVAQPFRSAPVPALAQPQIIEIDDGVVRQARSGGFKAGLTAGIVFGGVLLVLGWVGGGASSQGKARAQGIRDAHDLSADLTKARSSLEDLKSKLQDGEKTLVADKKFPTALGQTLSGMNVDFAGDKLFGRRFSGVPADTTRQLFDFITRVQALNDKKDLVVSLLAKLQKPISEELARSGNPISYVVVLDKDTPNTGAILARLDTPIAPDDKNGVPNDLLFVNPRSGSKVRLPRLTSEKIAKDGVAVTVVPNTFESACPSATHGQIAQLASSMRSLIGDIEGQKSAEGGDVVTETKAGLSETASKLADSLAKVE